ncbi:hypothetical protein NPIL_260511 [Nephila pilipes]|uniref:Uncharacterized protein n=1 Tax=Nephila pilipes TaxID=299642 RepID=A0A8X6PCP0_NEPPI|nr:hypothetical protein NPIL_260511 [Nephila pilipes]
MESPNEQLSLQQRSIRSDKYPLPSEFTNSRFSKQIESSKTLETHVVKNFQISMGKWAFQEQNLIPSPSPRWIMSVFEAIHLLLRSL